jgi:hypothetical protein
MITKPIHDRQTITTKSRLLLCLKLMGVGRIPTPIDIQEQMRARRLDPSVLGARVTAQSPTKSRRIPGNRAAFVNETRGAWAQSKTTM